MRASDLDLLFAPGSGELSPDHWISRWSAKLSTARLVDMSDPLEAPAAIVAAARTATRPVMLIGHSTGAIAVALAAGGLDGTDVRGALFVAPPDDQTLTTLDGGAWPAAPRVRLRWPSVLVASRTDPWASLSQSQALAADWGADFIDAGEAGRLDADAGYGPWPDGLLRLAAFLKKLG